MKACLREVPGGVLLDIHVVPNSSKESISYDEYSKRLKVKVMAPAVDGKANKGVLGVFSKIFPKTEIYSGAKSRKKTLFIPNKGLNDVLGVLSKK